MGWMTETSLRVILIALAVCCGSASCKGYKFADRGNGSFTVSVGGVKIIDHTNDKPFLYLGRGSTKFLEYRGNFNIKDYTLERIGLKLIKRTSTANGDQLIMVYNYNAENITVNLGSKEGHPLTVDISDLGDQYDRLWVRIAAQPSDAIYGGGEQYSYLNLRGRQYPIWTREQGVGRNKSTLVTFQADVMERSGGDYHTTYFPQPTFYSSQKYYFHHGGSNYAILDFGHQDFHEVFIMGKPGRLYVNTGKTFNDLVTKLTGFLGRMPPLPDWIYDGAIIGIQGGTKKMLEYIDYCDQYDIKLSGVWIQDWAGTIQTGFGKRIFWNWRWNATTYPDLNSTIPTLKERGIRVLGYINPNLNKEGDLFAIGDQKGYFFKNATGQTYLQDFGEFECGTVDLTNPDAYQWYKNEVVKKYSIDLGLGGWMADFGEYLPVDVHAFSGEAATIVHNKYPVLWAKLNREAVEESGNLGEVVFWMRAGYSGTGNYTTLMWAGDQNVDFSYGDGLASTIPASFNMGLSGAGITHFDIGGYTTFAPLMVRTEELLLRSAEAAVFGPVFRSHEGNQPAANKQFYSSPGISMKFSRLTEMFTLLKNYSQHVVNITTETGIPAQRPLFMQYENDVGSQDVAYEYMYGDDVLVAPVISAGKSSWNVHLPKDPDATSKWVHLWSKEEYDGAQDITVEAPIGQPPVFYKSTSKFSKTFEAIGNMPLVVVPTTQPPQTEPNTTPSSTMSVLTSVTLLTISASFLAILSSLV
ncbi:hypothetical protein LOTGIDRAFT_196733 [Lottia gigantea]|uniref:Alpha-glucosidase n=1 Tax=Lottia gigantea TaxID=225164 RepID=V3ZTR3_LOTGI|nr:hypothetical protein LOTGIDRAFT_196733 [Lottia gigantea]ESO84316.1 hypothetical protein LOTGIDRAFT_196733 [Lottia gigantea]